MRDGKHDKVSLVAVIIIILIIAGIIIPQFAEDKKEKKKREWMNITKKLESLKPEIWVDRARLTGSRIVTFYIVKNQWGWGLIQLKDLDSDEDLDQVFCSKSDFGLDPNVVESFKSFDINVGMPSDISFGPDSNEWDQWVLRFQEVLEYHKKKLKYQERLREEARKFNGVGL